MARISVNSFWKVQFWTFVWTILWKRVFTFFFVKILQQNIKINGIANYNTSRANKCFWKNSSTTLEELLTAITPLYSNNCWHLSSGAVFHAMCLSAKDNWNKFNFRANVSRIIDWFFGAINVSICIVNIFNVIIKLLCQNEIFFRVLITNIMNHRITLMSYQL